MHKKFLLICFLKFLIFSTFLRFVTHISDRIRYFIEHVTFHLLLKSLMSLSRGDGTEYLKLKFRKFILGLISLPMKFPKTRLLQVITGEKRL